MATGELVKIEPGGEITRLRIDRKTGPTMVEIRSTIGGGYYAQLGMIFEGKKRVGYVDEDAKCKKNPPPVNAYATRMVQEFYPEGGTVDILGSVGVWVPDDGDAQFSKKPLKPESLTGGTADVS